MAAEKAELSPYLAIYFTIPITDVAKGFLKMTSIPYFSALATKNALNLS
jgi:hypothetical protein